MNNYGWTPKQWASFSLPERAIVIAGIQMTKEQEEAERRKQESEMKGR
ncbi:hypothetical protein V6B05_01670 [Lactococcus garvieae]|nr:hypothetical protein [Lactococcus garvieae]MCI3860136.1 hypothetical protein [Lactococcus garvieae]